MHLSQREPKGAAAQLRVDVTSAELAGYEKLEDGIMEIMKHPNVVSFSQQALSRQELHEILIICRTVEGTIEEFDLSQLIELLHQHLGALIEFDVTEQAQQAGEESRTLLIACYWRPITLTERL